TFRQYLGNRLDLPDILASGHALDEDTFGSDVSPLPSPPGTPPGGQPGAPPQPGGMTLLQIASGLKIGIQDPQTFNAKILPTLQDSFNKAAKNKAKQNNQPIPPPV